MATQLLQFREGVTTRWTDWRRSGVLSFIGIGVAFAIFWWLVVVLVIVPNDIVEPWGDQRTNFTQAPNNLDDPYQTPGYTLPPWTAVMLLPFSLMPLNIAVLTQMMIYFGALGAMVHQFGGTLRTLVISLSTFISFIVSLEMNIDWLPVIGLLMPAAFSGIFIFIKPQIVLGVYLSYPRKALLRMVAVLSAVVLFSFLIWGFWPIDMWEAIERYTLRDDYFEPFNLAPLVRLTPFISIPIGIALGWIAFRRRDPVLSILAWFFFVPYIPFYSTLIYFTLLAIKLPRIALLINVVMWIIYGGALVYFGIV